MFIRYFCRTDVSGSKLFPKSFGRCSPAVVADEGALLTCLAETNHAGSEDGKVMCHFI
jgi:uncharacterized protein (DUF488 family)